MQKVYYNCMKITHPLWLALAVPLALSPFEWHPHFSDFPASEPRQGTDKPLTAAALDSHEGLTIAADPWLSADRYKTTFPKKTPFAAGVVAIKMTLRNDSDDSIKIGFERIRLNLNLDENRRQALPPLNADDVADT